MILTAAVLLVSYMLLRDPVLRRLGEIDACLKQLETIRRIQKRIEDRVHQRWMAASESERQELLDLYKQLYAAEREVLRQGAASFKQESQRSESCVTAD